jgi:predicted RNA-binding Zn-ribbon protein involved in translation (DUF1610 family)
VASIRLKTGGIMTISKYYCPSCGKRISWRQKCKLINLAGFRKFSPCPHCGKLLIWSKWPSRMINIGWISCCLLLVISSLFSKIEDVRVLIIFLITVLLMLWGIFTMKLEGADSDEKKEF